MPWYRKLHWQIIIGLILGLIYGVVAAAAGWNRFTSDWIGPWGTIFLRLLELIAVPLVLASLITGVASLSNLQKLSRIGGKTIGIYIGTTFVALVIGLIIVNVLQPGATVPEDVRERLEATYSEDVAEREVAAEAAKERGSASGDRRHGAWQFLLLGYEQPQHAPNRLLFDFHGYRSDPASKGNRGAAPQRIRES